MITYTFLIHSHSFKSWRWLHYRNSTVQYSGVPTPACTCISALCTSAWFIWYGNMQESYPSSLTWMRSLRGAFPTVNPLPHCPTRQPTLMKTTHLRYIPSPLNPPDMERGQNKQQDQCPLLTKRTLTCHLWGLQSHMSESVHTHNIILHVHFGRDIPLSLREKWDFPPN